MTDIGAALSLKLTKGRKQNQQEKGRWANLPNEQANRCGQDGELRDSHYRQIHEQGYRVRDPRTGQSAKLALSYDRKPDELFVQTFERSHHYERCKDRSGNQQETGDHHSAVAQRKTREQNIPADVKSSGERASRQDPGQCWP
jgi:hypothetical protein